MSVDISNVATMSEEEIAKEVGSVTPSSAIEKVPQEVLSQVESMVSRVKDLDERDIDGKNSISEEAKTMGAKIRKSIAHQSDLLNAPMNSIMSKNQEGGDIAKDLLELRQHVEKVNPNKFDFKEGGFRKFLSKLPGIGSKLELWWSQYQSVSVVINDILNNLESGKEVLKKDNVTLKADRDVLLGYTYTLTDQLRLAMLLDKELEVWAKDDANSNQKYIEEDVLYYLRQEIQDMQLSLGAANQSILVADIIRRANEELIRSTDRTLNISSQALKSAAGLEVALTHQKRQLDAVKSTNDMTTELLKGTAAKAKTQGVEVVKQANDISAQIEGLQQAFSDCLEAMDILDSYKQEALPAMQNNITVLNDLNVKMKENINRNN